MSKGLGFGIAVFIGVFGGFNYLLNQESNPIAKTDHSDQAEKKVILAMAAFVEKNPNIIEVQKGLVEHHPDRKTIELPHDARAPIVAGVPLDERSIQELRAESGLERFKSQVGPNPQGAIQDVHQAWYSIEDRDFKRREALLEVTNGLAKVSNDTSLRGMFLSEVNKFYTQSSDENKNTEYAGKALQHYLNNEPDLVKMNENLDKMGIPHVVIPPIEGLTDGRNRAPASVPAQ
jgi:hypothetical protein